MPRGGPSTHHSPDARAALRREAREARDRQRQRRERWAMASALVLLVLLPVVGAWLGGRVDPADPADSAQVDEKPAAPEAQPAAQDPAPAEEPVDDGAPWSYATGDEAWAPPLVADSATGRSLILVGADDGALHALDPRTGAAIWTHTTGGPVRRRAVVASGRAGDIAVWASADGALYGADLEGGTLRWRARVGPTSTPATGLDRSVVAVGTRTGVMVLSAVDGAVRWRSGGSTGGGDEVAAVALGGTRRLGIVVAATKAGRINAYDLANGRALWTFDGPSTISNDLVVAPRSGTADLVLALADDGLLLALDLARGLEIWRAQTSELGGATPAVADGLVVLGGGDGSLRAYDPARGIELWRRGLSEPVRGTPTVVATSDDPGARVVWVTVGDRHLAAVDARDGAPLHSFEVDAWISGPPAFAAGRLIFASSEGRIHGLPVDPPRELFPADAVADRWRLERDPELLVGGVPEVAWRYRAGDALAAAPAFTVGRVVVGAGSRLVALDAASGEVQWSFAPEGSGRFDATPAMLGGRVLATARAGADGLGRLHAVDVTAGRGLWSLEVAGDLATTPALWRDLVLFGGHDTAVRAVALADGAPRWSFDTAGIVVSSPVVVAGRRAGIAVAASCDGHVYGLSADDGRELWRFRATDCLTADLLAATGPGGTVVYAADSRGTVYALDPVVGGELWRFSARGGAGRRLAIDYGALFVASGDRRLWSIAQVDGYPIWHTETRGPMTSGVAILDGVAYAGSHDGRLYAFGAVNGQELWRLDTGRPVLDVATDGTAIYAASADGSLYAVRVEDPVR